MLGIILLIFIGRSFYRLAQEYDKKGWHYALLSIVVYYGSTFVFGFLIGLFDVIFDLGILDTVSDTVLGLITMPFALLLMFIIYKQLEKNLKKGQVLKPTHTIEDFGKTENDKNFE